MRQHDREGLRQLAGVDLLVHETMLEDFRTAKAAGFAVAAMPARHDPEQLVLAVAVDDDGSIRALGDCEPREHPLAPFLAEWRKPHPDARAVDVLTSIVIDADSAERAAFAEFNRPKPPKTWAERSRDERQHGEEEPPEVARRLEYVEATIHVPPHWNDGDYSYCVQTQTAYGACISFGVKRPTTGGPLHIPLVWDARQPTELWLLKRPGDTKVGLMARIAWRGTKPISLRLEPGASDDFADFVRRTAERGNTLVVDP